MRIPASMVTRARTTALALDAQDLERALVEGRRDLDDERLGRRQLAGEAVSLAHQVVAELELVVDRAGRRPRPRRP